MRMYSQPVIITKYIPDDQEANKIKNLSFMGLLCGEKDQSDTKIKYK